MAASPDPQDSPIPPDAVRIDHVDGATIFVCTSEDCALKTFATMGNFRRHFKEKHGGSVLVCEVKGPSCFSTSRQYLMDKHLLKHTPSHRKRSQSLDQSPPPTYILDHFTSNVDPAPPAKKPKALSKSTSSSVFKKSNQKNNLPIPPCVPQECTRDRINFTDALAAGKQQVVAWTKYIEEMVRAQCHAQATDAQDSRVAQVKAELKEARDERDKEKGRVADANKIISQSNGQCVKLQQEVMVWKQKAKESGEGQVREYEEKAAGQLSLIETRREVDVAKDKVLFFQQEKQAMQKELEETQRQLSLLQKGL